MRSPALATLLLLGLIPGCDPVGALGPDRVAPPPAGRLLILRSTARGLELVRSRALTVPPRARRAWPRGWRGEYEVQRADGAVLARGRFHLPGMVHSPPAIDQAPISVLPPAPATWLRVATPVGAARVVLFRRSAGGRVMLGEVKL